MSNTFEWDASQRKVIHAPAEDRLYVSAGPGTGKTAVACARVSQLIARGCLDPAGIWMISFTRTAVGEIRDKIGRHLNDQSAARTVNIATLDRYAWMIHSGYDTKARILGSYEENIKRVLELIQHDEQVAELLEDIQHLVVDEAQDFVGIRSDLIIELICRLPSACGVTIFTDEAQAIYEFTDNREDMPAISELIRGGDAGEFREQKLTEIHRTELKKLKKLFKKVRRKVLNSDLDSFDKDEYLKIRSQLRNRCSSTQQTSANKATLILYRRKCDVLQKSAFLLGDGTVHRVRMSGLPVNLVSWIGVALSEYTKMDLTKDAFEKLWFKRVRGTHLETCRVEDAWTALWRLGGRKSTLIDMCLLRKRLGSEQPPIELCLPWFGGNGPLVSTIHASKGQEAEEVHLMLPDIPAECENWKEECRILLVGATRARSKLIIDDAKRQFVKSIKSSKRSPKRIYSNKTKWNKHRAQVVIGLKDDIDAEGLAGKSLFSSYEEISKAQNFFCQNRVWPLPISTESDPQADYRYRVYTQDKKRCLAILSKNVNNDLFSIADEIGKKGKLRPPDYIQYLSILGVRTIVLPPNFSEADKLHEPWRTSGIILAPQILGYSTMPFIYRRT